MTLIELMVATGIFVLVGIGSAGLLNNVTSSQEALNKHADRLTELQRFFLYLEMDVDHIVPRTSRDNYGDLQPPVFAQNSGAFEFTRQGWVNPQNQRQRSEMQRVQYEWVDNIVYRKYWQAVDRTDDAEPISVKMLRNVEEFTIRFLDEDPSTKDQLWLDIWPANTGGTGLLIEETLPVSIEVTINTEDYGEIKRFFRIAKNIYAP